MNKKISISRFSFFLLFATFLGAISFLGFVPQQQSFSQIIIPYTICFVIYFLFAFKIDLSLNFKALVVLAVLSRLVLVFSLPNLSDDIYRFLWDAELVLQGRNPYLFLPEDIVTAQNQALYDQLNSQSYYSPYPPVAQVIYSLAAFISASKLHIFSIIIKLLTVVAELGTFYYIARLLNLLNIDKSRIFIYALNPLIIIELVGNIHFESFMVLFMIATVYYLIKDQSIKSAGLFVLAIASKLLPLMFTPFLLSYLGIKKSIKFCLLTGGLLLVLFIPIMIGVANGTFLSSVGLYFQKFEFNASLYYLIREIGFLIYGWNIINTIGPILGILALSLICSLWFKNRAIIDKQNIFALLLFTITIYLFTATTIHPWYLALPLAFCLFTDYRFPVIWSGLIFFTYYNYSSDPYHENLWIVFVEYTIVFGFLVIELRRKPRWKIG